MKPIFLTLILIALAGCQASDAQSKIQPPPDYHLDHVGSKADVQELYNQLQSYGQIGRERDAAHPNSDPRPPDFAVAALLPKIHSWLQPGHGLVRQKINGENVLILRSLPLEVLAEITSVTFDEEHRSGFLILQQSFWQMVREKMMGGLTIGFFDYDSVDRVNGMYIDNYKLILVDMISNEGTLIHESRHNDQYVALQRHAPHKPVAMSRACLEGSSQFFAELDATTTELPAWQGAFQMFDTHPALDAVNPAIAPEPSLERILWANLGYPQLAYASWVASIDQPDACPQELRAVMGIIVGATDDFATAASAPIYDVVGAQARDLRTQTTEAQDHCDISPNDSECLRCEKTVAESQKQGQAAKDAFDQIMGHAQLSRIDMIQKALLSLPRDIATDLCYGALGFEFYYDCSEILKETY